MEYLGDKLSVAHSQVSGWVGNVRRSLHGALSFLSNSMERGGRAEDDTGDFKRTSSLRSLASRSRESIRRFSLRSQQRLSLRRRTAPNTPTAVQQKQRVRGEEEGKDSETLVHETDSQYGTWETGLRTDDRTECLTTSSHIPLLPDYTARPHLIIFVFSPLTEVKVENKDDDSDSEEQSRVADFSPAVASQPQRIAMFPGMDPSALMAQLKKRGDSDSQVDGSTPSPSQLSRSPKSPFLPRAARVLPTPGGKENGEENSPQWLKELKSKKRLSQYETES
uniref:Tankyrase 1-binding protein C-terminal domain-containing protein n=1 Tax=Mastacembelus armatus TaxID=205130 RepID=A0A7N8WWI4_9TELE